MNTERELAIGVHEMTESDLDAVSGGVACSPCFWETLPALPRLAANLAANRGAVVLVHERPHA
jgi:hypothetical protein